MRCPKCGKNVYSHHQEIDWTKTKIMRRYGCRNCHYKFRTIERIIELEYRQVPRVQIQQDED